MTRSTSSSAISGFASGRRCPSGTPARAQRPGSAVHSSGRNRRSPTGTGTSPLARVSETRTWQLARLPRQPQHCRATPTECLPCFGRAVSSITSTASGPPTSASAPHPRAGPPARPAPPPPEAARERPGRRGRAADEVVQLLRATGCHPGRQRLDALALPRQDQALEVDRPPAPLRLAAQCRQERRQPALQRALPAPQRLALSHRFPPARSPGPTLGGGERPRVVLGSRPGLGAGWPEEVALDPCA